MAILVTCPYCDDRREWDEECAGTDQSCHGCGRIIPIPEKTRGVWAAGCGTQALGLVILAVFLLCGALAFR